MGPEILGGPALLALAVFFPRAEPGATVRLIDNRLLCPQPEERP